MTKPDFTWKKTKLRDAWGPAQAIPDFQTAVDLLDQRDKDLPEPVNPACRTLFLNHGKATDHVVVMLHGYTSSPPQFAALGQEFYLQGWNVLIPRMPHHGLLDRMSTDQTHLDAHELAMHTAQVLDCAHGLGKHVHLMGISAGGVMCAWAVQNRNDLDSGFIISPALGFRAIPSWLTGLTALFIPHLADAMEWWDPMKKDQVGPDYAYPKYSRHALAQLLRLGCRVIFQARRRPPACPWITILSNQNDQSVSLERIKLLQRLWARRGFTPLSHEFTLQDGLPHDLVSPEQPDQNTALVYPKIHELMEKTLARMG